MSQYLPYVYQFLTSFFLFVIFHLLYLVSFVLQKEFFTCGTAHLKRTSQSEKSACDQLHFSSDKADDWVFLFVFFLMYRIFSLIWILNRSFFFNVSAFFILSSFFKWWHCFLEASRSNWSLFNKITEDF